jgi:hypothetical protein
MNNSTLWLMYSIWAAAVLLAAVGLYLFNEYALSVLCVGALVIGTYAAAPLLKTIYGVLTT